MRRIALLGALLLLLADPAWAAPAKKAEEAFGLLVVLPGLLALFFYPVGLAFHALVLAYAPRRGLTLVHRVGAHRGKTLALGAANTLFLLLVAAVCAKQAPALSALAVVTWVMLALVGSHGLARSLGARVLGRDAGDHPAPPGDLKALALGWFVLVGASALPFLGWLLLAYWSVRSTGGVVLALFGVSEPPPPAPASDDPYPV